MLLTRTRAAAAQLLALSECGSTNAELRERASDAAQWPHLSVLVTDSQTAGRGRLGRTWTTPPGAALAVSVLLRDLPSDLDAWGWLPLAAGVAMTDAIGAQLSGHEVGLKWPNDVLVDGRKICGILTEVHDGAVIIGTGINTAMTADQLPVPTATSFAALGADADVDRLISDYLGRLASIVADLVTTPDAVASGLHAAATQRCVTLGQEVAVSLPAERMLHGRAMRLGSDGRLIVDDGHSEHEISAGDVVHVRPA